jgi:hypothetical protein
MYYARSSNQILWVCRQSYLRGNTFPPPWSRRSSGQRQFKFQLSSPLDIQNPEQAGQDQGAERRDGLGQAPSIRRVHHCLRSQAAGAPEDYIVDLRGTSLRAEDSTCFSNFKIDLPHANPALCAAAIFFRAQLPRASAGKPTIFDINGCVFAKFPHVFSRTMRTGFYGPMPECETSAIKPRQGIYRRAKVKIS